MDLQALRGKTKAQVKRLAKEWPSFKDAKPTVGAIAMVDGKGQCLFGTVQSGGAVIKFEDGDRVKTSQLTSGKFAQEGGGAKTGAQGGAQGGAAAKFSDPRVLKAMYIDKRGCSGSDRSRILYRFKAKGSDAQATWDLKHVQTQLGGAVKTLALELIEKAEAKRKANKPPKKSNKSDAEELEAPKEKDDAEESPEKEGVAPKEEESDEDEDGDYEPSSDGDDSDDSDEDDSDEDDNDEADNDEDDNDEADDQDRAVSDDADDKDEADKNEADDNDGAMSEADDNDGAVSETDDNDGAMSEADDNDGAMSDGAESEAKGGTDDAEKKVKSDEITGGGLDALPVVKLRAMLKDYGKPTSGKKQELIDRLESAQGEGAESAQDEEEAKEGDAKEGGGAQEAQDGLKRRIRDLLEELQSLVDQLVA